MTLRSSVAIRFALVGLFLWFGTMQLINPSAWTAFLPEATGYLPIPGEMLVQLNGWFEVIAALMLLLGCYARLMALLLGAHLMVIAITAGGAIGARDATLAIVTLALAASPSDELTLDAKLARHTANTPPSTEPQES